MNRILLLLSLLFLFSSPTLAEGPTDEASAEAAVLAAWKEMDGAYSRYDAQGALKYFTSDFTMKIGMQKIGREQMEEILNKQLAELKQQGGKTNSSTSIFTFALEKPTLARVYTITETTTQPSPDTPAETSKEMRMEYWENGPDGWMCKSGELVQRD